MSKNKIKEYESFLKSDMQVPVQTSEQTLGKMKSLLHPSAFSVFVKLLGIHFVIGTLSLSVCHQFEMNPFGTEFSLDDWFMSAWGHQACMVFCGILFVSLSVLSAGFVLSLEEARSLKQTSWAQILVLGIFSLSAFIAMGAELALTLVALWLLGAFIGGFATTYIVWKSKQIILD